MSIVQKTVQPTDARRITDAAKAKAHELKVAISVAVVDAGGYLLVFERAEHAWPGSVELAIAKAWTARTFERETRELNKLAQPGGGFYGVEATHAGRVCLLAGGIPLVQDGLVVGAVGVSGGDAKQDQEIAEAAAKAF